MDTQSATVASHTGSERRGGGRHTACHAGHRPFLLRRGVPHGNLPGPLRMGAQAHLRQKAPLSLPQACQLAALHGVGTLRNSHARGDEQHSGAHSTLQRLRPHGDGAARHGAGSVGGNSDAGGHRTYELHHGTPVVQHYLSRGHAAGPAVQAPPLRHTY